VWEVYDSSTRDVYNTFYLDHYDASEDIYYDGYYDCWSMEECCYSYYYNSLECPSDEELAYAEYIEDTYEAPENQSDSYNYTYGSLYDGYYGDYYDGQYDLYYDAYYDCYQGTECCFSYYYFSTDCLEDSSYQFETYDTEYITEIQVVYAESVYAETEVEEEGVDEDKEEFQDFIDEVALDGIYIDMGYIEDDDNERFYMFVILMLSIIIMTLIGLTCFLIISRRHSETDLVMA
jgi:hypothetical protein